MLVMTSDRIYRIQCYLFGVAAVSAILGLSTKAVIVKDPALSKFIEFDFFVFNFSHAGLWVYIHWLSSTLFLGALAIAGILENKKKNTR